MSWWDIGTTDEVIGDQSADIVVDALKELVAARAAQGLPKPTVQDMADAATAVLATSLQQLTSSSADLDLQGVRVVIEGRPAVLAQHVSVHSNPRLEAALHAAFTAVTSLYQKRWGRKPTLTELLENLLFVLGGSTRNYIADPCDGDIFLAGIDAITTKRPVAAT